MEKEIKPRGRGQSGAGGKRRCMGTGREWEELGLAEDMRKAWSHQGKGMGKRDVSSGTKNIRKGLKQEKKPEV